MKLIKKVEFNGEKLEVVSYNGIFYILHNELPLANSMEFNFISNLFDDFFIKLKGKYNGKN